MQPSKISQRYFRSKVGDEAVLYIRPGQVANHTGTKWPVAKAHLKSAERVMPRAIARLLLPALKKREPFVIPTSQFRDPTPMIETARYRKVADFINRNGGVQGTLWFKDLKNELEHKGVARHKDFAMRDVSEIHDFFQSYVIPMIESLRREGFRPNETGYESAAVIDAEGRLSKTGSGNHRFAICQVLDLPTFPLRVVAVHADWYAREVMPFGDTWISLKAALTRVRASHQ